MSPSEECINNACLHNKKHCGETWDLKLWYILEEKLARGSVPSSYSNPKEKFKISILQEINLKTAACKEVTLPLLHSSGYLVTNK